MILAHLAAAYVYATAMEWVVHNLVYHQLGRKLGGQANFHFREHHKDTRLNAGLDPAFDKRTWAWDAHGRETFGLLAMVALHLPFLVLAPAFFAGIAAMAVLYHYCHRRSHRDARWCMETLPWHWEHHFGRDPNANFCLTSDWFDRLVGTRKEYPELFGTPEERIAA